MSSYYETNESSLIKLLKQCSRLEKLTCNNAKPISYVSANGVDVAHENELAARECQIWITMDIP